MLDTETRSLLREIFTSTEAEQLVDALKAAPAVPEEFPAMAMVAVTFRLFLGSCAVADVDADTAFSAFLEGSFMNTVATVRRTA